MKRIIFVLCVALARGVTLYAQEAVDSAELQNADGTVEFISNTASPSRIDSRAQIIELGRGPGAVVRRGAETAGSRGRYFVIHRTYPEEFDKLDADIFGLGAGAGVDTIANLRLIIQGYLQSAYDYSESDAALLAEYITIYNAVYRRNRAYFERRYKTPLLKDLTAGSEGIALRFDEWPGQTLMLVPLMTAQAGSLSAIDTSAITDPSVIDKMREDPDKGVNTRQDMVALKEREADAAAAAAAKQKQENAGEQQRVASEEKRIAAEKAQVEAEKAAATTPAEKAAAAEKEAELQKEEAALNESKEELAAKQEEARKQEEFAERKTEEAQSDRTSIAADQNAVLAVAAAPAAVEPAGILAVQLTPGASPRGTIVKVNPSSGVKMKSSPLSKVSGRSLTNIGGKTIVAADSGGKTKLVEIDPSTLQTLKQGEDELNADTQIWVSGANLYAIVSSGGKNYIGRFDINLVRQALSEQVVHPWAALNFQGDKIVTQNGKGEVIFLNAQDLKTDKGTP